MNEKEKVPTRLERLAQKGAHLREEMWRAPNDLQKRSETILYATLRVLAVTFSGIKENRLIIRAAALSFSSLLGLGPLIAISVLVSGIVLEKTDPDLAVDTIEKAIAYIAPQTQISSEELNGASADEANESPKLRTLQEQLVEMSQSMPAADVIEDENFQDLLNQVAANQGGAAEEEEIRGLLQQFIEGSQSGAVGVVGTIVLILIVIQLFAAIEDAFNDIWGVQRGRGWLSRIVMYWTITSLGAVLTFAGIAIVSLQQERLERLAAYIPNKFLLDTLALYGPGLLTFILVIALLAGFYKFIPNTTVTWKASLIGAAFAVCCIVGNNLLAFFYFSRVALQRSLYGPVGGLLVLVFGLFIFWVILLLGGRMTYAVQNARFRSNKIAWDALSYASQESISLLVFLKLCRRFRNCEQRLNAAQLADEAKLPIQIINSSLNRLCEIGLATSVEAPPSKKDRYPAPTFQPARPLDKIQLTEFKEAFESFGNTPDTQLYDAYDPILKDFHQILDAAQSSSKATITIDEALAQEARLA